METGVSLLTNVRRAAFVSTGKRPGVWPDLLGPALRFPQPTFSEVVLEPVE